MLICFFFFIATDRGPLDVCHILLSQVNYPFLARLGGKLLCAVIPTHFLHLLLSCC